MEVISDIKNFQKPDFSVVTIGTFDGVHLGHQTIIRQIVEKAKQKNGRSLLVTFWPHPRFVIGSIVAGVKLLTTFEEKTALIGDLGVDYIVKLPFTKEFSAQTAEQFLSNILVQKLGVRDLFIGYDHHFGNNREGNLTFLKEKEDTYGYKVCEIPRQDIDDIGISSTKIRSALGEGKVELAKALLGRSYSITGRVIKGKKIGRKIGFPTANIEIPEPFKLLPSDGVYAVKARVKHQWYGGMMNIGFKPTVSSKAKSVEVHLFDFNENIYGKDMKVEFVTFIRNEMKFTSLDDLTRQLHCDKAKTIKYLI